MLGNYNAEKKEEWVSHIFFCTMCLYFYSTLILRLSSYLYMPHQQTSPSLVHRLLWDWKPLLQCNAQFTDLIKPGEWILCRDS